MERKFRIPMSFVVSEVIDVWPEGMPGAELASKSPEVVTERGDEYHDRTIANVSRPQIFPFPAPAAKATGRAVLVCPGGGYTYVTIDNEGFEVARYLNSLGISAFVLKYRDPAVDGKFGVFPEGPLSDALRAMRWIRKNAAKYAVNPNDLGIMGFSSGGHLCCSASTLYGTLADPDPELNAISARPDFTIAIYPVVSFVNENQHRGSVLRLLGGESTMNMLQRFSLEKQVNAQTPPAFIIHSADDPVVPCWNGLAYAQALVNAKVPVEMHLFPEGAHGYGMKLAGISKDIWPLMMANWLEHLKIR